MPWAGLTDPSVNLKYTCHMYLSYRILVRVCLLIWSADICCRSASEGTNEHYFKISLESTMNCWEGCRYSEMSSLFCGWEVLGATGPLETGFLLSSAFNAFELLNVNMLKA